MTQKVLVRCAVTGKDMSDWHLADPAELPKPIPCRGRLGLWIVPSEVEAQILRSAGD